MVGGNYYLVSRVKKAKHAEIFEAATQECMSKLKELNMYTEKIQEDVSGKPKDIGVADRIQLQHLRRSFKAQYIEDSPLYMIQVRKKYM